MPDFKKHPKPVLFVVGLFLASVVEITDLLTGPEIAFSIFYLVVVAYFTWFLGLWYGVAASVVCGILSVTTDVITGVRHSHLAVPFWLAVMRMTNFTLVAVILTKLQSRQKELNAAVAELKRSNAELDHFTAMVSHDLQTPLRTISLFCELLEKEGGAGKGKDYVEHIRSSAARMQRLISDLLSYARLSKEGVRHEDVDLKVLIGDLTRDLHALIEDKKGRVKIEELPVIRANPLLMRQLFQNLIGNSLKYSKQEEPPSIAISSRVDKDAIRIYVRDNGTGFEEACVEKIFTPFQRLHSDVEGTGIGLPICRKIAEQHGGGITAKSVPGEGATFILELPNDIVRSPCAKSPGTMAS